MKEKKNSNIPYSLIAFLMSGVMLGLLVVSENSIFLMPLVVCLPLGFAILIYECCFEMELFKEDSFLRDARKAYSRLKKKEIKTSTSTHITCTLDEYKKFRSEIHYLLYDKGVSAVDEDTIVKILIKKFSTQKSIFPGTTPPVLVNFLIISYTFLICAINVLYPFGWISLLRPEVITTISFSEMMNCVLSSVLLIILDYILVRFLTSHEKEKYNSLEEIIREVSKSEEHDETVNHVHDLEDEVL